jgi:putative flavoprotein involved in K+ transport
MTGTAGRQAIDTVVIGAGQAGLSVSYFLKRENRPHIVLEKDCVGSTWKRKRWDSFTLVTPNWMNQLPDFGYRGSDPDGFLLRDEVVQYLQDYARFFDAPVECGVTANRVSRNPDGSAYRVETTSGTYEARNVVVTTGYFNRDRTAPFAGAIPKSVVQIHSGEYRKPGLLAPGAVLVIGSGQSGCQIAEDLQEAGRDVYLSVGGAGRQPRRYRGKDICWWLAQAGVYNRSFQDPANPVERYQPNPHCSGKGGGHALNLEKFAASGITLLGRVTGLQASRLVLAPDIRDAVSKADQFSKKLMKLVDGFIDAAKLQVPAPSDDNTDDGTPRQPAQIEEIRELDLAARGITTIIWAAGYTCDFSWIDLSVFDDRGYPLQQRGVCDLPGLYFCGLHWLHCLKSGLIFGAGEDAQHVTRHLLSNR